MPDHSRRPSVVVLAPMPLELDAIVSAFGLHPTGEGPDASWSNRVGECDVRALHIGMGPALTRLAVSSLLEASGDAPVDHVMIAGICGGLDPDVEVGALVNPAFVVEHSTGATYRHDPPADAPLAGKLITTEAATLDADMSRRFFEEGYVAVDMESSAVAEVCEQMGCRWSVYRCVGDRYFDGLLDERVVALTNPDGSADTEGIVKLISAEPDLAEKLGRLAQDASTAARKAAEAAVRGCMVIGAHWAS